MKKARYEGGQTVHMSCTGDIIGSFYSEANERWEYTILVQGNRLMYVPEALLIGEERERDEEANPKQI